MNALKKILEYRLWEIENQKVTLRGAIDNREKLNASDKWELELLEKEEKELQEVFK